MDIKTGKISVVISFILVLSLCSGAGAFDIPERLEYDLKWLGIKAGESALEINSIGGERVMIVSTSRSIGWVSFFYPVDDRVESVFDMKSAWYPVMYHLKTFEGDREKDWEIFFDSNEGKATYVDHIKKENRKYDVPKIIYDPLSALYRIRKTDLSVGVPAYIKLFDSKKVYDLEVKVLRRETITVPAGTFDTILITPILQSEGIFSREGPVYTWLTDDEKRIPVMVKTKVAVGSVSAVLVGGSY
ncbi:MAG: DUF3108 domain-containing protein [Thermodesulfovibrionales bacterium]